MAPSTFPRTFDCDYSRVNVGPLKDRSGEGQVFSQAVPRIEKMDRVLIGSVFLLRHDLRRESIGPTKKWRIYAGVTVISSDSDRGAALRLAKQNSPSRQWRRGRSRRPIATDVAIPKPSK